MSKVMDSVRTGSWKWAKGRLFATWFNPLVEVGMLDSKEVSLTPAQQEHISHFLSEVVRQWDEWYSKTAMVNKHLEAENEGLRFKLEWLMKQPALQHYDVKLELDGKIEAAPPTPKFHPESVHPESVREENPLGE